MNYPNKLIKLFSVLLLGFVSSVIYAADTNSPVGYWKTIDDVTGNPKSIVKIYETPNHTLQGQVMRIFPSPGKDQNEVCTACEGINHNKRIVGMNILWGMVFDGEKWNSGRILDPKTGNIYRCTLRVTDGGKNMDVHGYIGLSFIGRTQTWIRITKA
jgi:uncharacterized protein (DUF2147 family)